jgi:hypothetical protein
MNVGDRVVYDPPAEAAAHYRARAAAHPLGDVWADRIGKTFTVTRIVAYPAEVFAGIEIEAHTDVAVESDDGDDFVCKIGSLRPAK